MAPRAVPPGRSLRPGAVWRCVRLGAALRRTRRGGVGPSTCSDRHWTSSGPISGSRSQCVALCFVTSLVLGLLPAIRFSRPSIVGALPTIRHGPAAASDGCSGSLPQRRPGIAVPLLVISGLQLDQARVTALTDVGFSPAGLYAARLNLSSASRTDDERRVFLRTVQESLAAGPWCDGGQRRRRHAPRLRVSQRARRTHAASRTSRRRTRRGSHRATSKHCERGCWPAAPSTRTTVKKAERVVMLSEPLATELFPGRESDRPADRPRPRCRRTAKLYGHRHHRRPGVHPDGQPASTAVPVARSGADRRR